MWRDNFFHVAREKVLLSVDKHTRAQTKRAITILCVRCGPQASALFTQYAAYGARGPWVCTRPRDWQAIVLPSQRWRALSYYVRRRSILICCELGAGPAA
eukprot:2809308-Lingulodinium_polyedra.AAC.1